MRFWSRCHPGLQSNEGLRLENLLPRWLPDVAESWCWLLAKAPVSHNIDLSIGLLECHDTMASFLQSECSRENTMDSMSFMTWSQKSYFYSILLVTQATCDALREELHSRNTRTEDHWGHHTSPSNLTLSSLFMDHQHSAISSSQNTQGCVLCLPPLCSS